MKQLRPKRQIIEPKGNCFVLMPFKPDLDEVYRSVIRPCSQRAGLSCARADDIYGPKPIMADIWRSIQNSTIVIADLTTRNPNVFYELGLCHAIQKPVILIAQDISDVPFDLRHLRVITYKNTEEGRRKLTKGLLGTLRHITTDMKGGHSRSMYTVLEPVFLADISDKKKVSKILKELASKIPSQVLKMLSKIEESDKDKTADPRITARVVELLSNSAVEIQEAAIKALGTIGSELHAIHLHRFFSSENPALTKSACSAVGELKDEAAIAPLSAIYQNPKYRACRENILQALSKIGGEDSASHLFQVASDGKSSREIRLSAVRVLADVENEHGARKLCEINLIGLDTDLRCQIGESIARCASPYEPSLQKLIEVQIRKLASDKQASVRGHALAAWYAHSDNCSEDGWLSETYFVKRLNIEAEETITACLEVFLIHSDSIPFGKSQANLLIKLIKKYPTLLRKSVFLLKDTANESASKLMLRAYNQFADERTWVLAYFGRVPSKGAIPLLENVLVSDPEKPHACLAALGLARLGNKEAIEHLLKHASEAYRWVQTDIRQFFQTLITNEKKSQRRKIIEQVIKKLPNGDF